MPRRARKPYEMQARVRNERLRARDDRWIPLDHHREGAFPRLTLDQLKAISIAIYQIQLAPTYI